MYLAELGSDILLFQSSQVVVVVVFLGVVVVFLGVVVVFLGVVVFISIPQLRCVPLFLVLF